MKLKNCYVEVAYGAYFTYGIKIQTNCQIDQI